MAWEFDECLDFFKILHALALIFCTYREIFDGSISTFSNFMRFLEISFSILLIGLVIRAIRHSMQLTIDDHE